VSDVGRRERDAQVPVLTEVVDEDAGARSRSVTPAALEALARELERASVTLMVREAVAASVARALAPPPRD
jgi:hypothetical protein